MSYVKALATAIRWTSSLPWRAADVRPHKKHENKLGFHGKKWKLCWCSCNYGNEGSCKYELKCNINIIRYVLNSINTSWWFQISNPSKWRKASRWCQPLLLDLVFVRPALLPTSLGDGKRGVTVSILNAGILQVDPNMRFLIFLDWLKGAIPHYYL